MRWWKWVVVAPWLARSIEIISGFSRDGASNNPQLLARQIRTSVESVEKSLAAAILAPLLLVFGVVWQSKDHNSVIWVAAAWSVAQTIVLLNLIGLIKFFKSKPRSDSKTLKWGRALVRNGFMAGFVWGLSSWLFLPASTPLEESWLIIAIAMVVLVAAGIQAAHRPVAITTVISLVTVFVAGLIRIGDSFHILLGVAFILYGWAILGFTDNLGRGIRSAIQLGFEKDALLRDTEVKTSALVALKEDAKIRAERENLEKSKFLADAAHDLRQPMQALTNLLHAAAHAIERSDQEKSRELLHKAQSALRAAGTSFNAILDISRLESGFVEAEYTSFEVGELIDDVLVPLRVAAAERNVELRVRRGKTAIVRSDGHLLGRVLSNLISNAIKYSDPAKGQRASVLVGVVCLPSHVRVDIVDNGIGIAKRHWDNIFKPFFQVDNPARDREMGLGLGLSIVKEIMSLLGQHRIDMHSIENRGTRFSLELPRSGEAHPVKPIKDGTDAVPDLSGMYVIYVEDDVLVRSSTAALFQEYRILHESVGSFSELEERIQLVERMPDLIITDYRLPDGRSAQDVSRLVAQQFDAGIPVIVVSGEADVPSGFKPAAVLTKPVSAATLFATISATSRRGCP